MDGVPSLGWHDTVAFLILPVLLVVSQFVSMELMQPKTASGDSAQQQSNAILKVLPLMIGWFSLNVPAALCVYWFVNNVITTGLSLFIRSNMPVAEMSTSAASSTSSSTPKAAIFTPPREKPSGFGSSDSFSSSSGGIKTLTKQQQQQPIVDAEVIESSSNDSETSSEASSSDESNKKRGGGKKKKN